jgi:hypothetical protein
MGKSTIRQYLGAQVFPEIFLDYWTTEDWTEELSRNTVTNKMKPIIPQERRYQIVTGT